MVRVCDTFILFYVPRLNQKHHQPRVAPVNKALFGGWEGNWMAYNTASDVVLPKSSGEKVHFFMYPVAENAAGRFDSYAPDDFKYQITAQEIMA